jgi:hypothetical protein
VPFDLAATGAGVVVLSDEEADGIVFGVEVPEPREETVGVADGLGIVLANGWRLRHCSASRESSATSTFSL